MPDTNTDKKIPVQSYTGGGEGVDLIDCYFKQKNDGTYDFHDKDDHTKCTGLTVGVTSPSFQLDEDSGIEWNITLEQPCSDTVVNGGWSADSGTAQDLEGGTFNAQAGGGGADDEDENKAAPQNIFIRNIKSHHGLTFGNVLKGCFFTLRESGKYDFCDPLGGVLKREVTWNDTFFFDFESQKWKMTSDIDTLKNKAHGSWELLEGIGDDIDGGTFQAQAGGGGGVEETAYSASAK